MNSAPPSDNICVGTQIIALVEIPWLDVDAWRQEAANRFLVKARNQTAFG